MEVVQLLFALLAVAAAVPGGHTGAVHSRFHAAHKGFGAIHGHPRHYAPMQYAAKRTAASHHHKKDAHTSVLRHHRYDPKKVAVHGGPAPAPILHKMAAVKMARRKPLHHRYSPSASKIPKAFPALGNRAPKVVVVYVPFCPKQAKQPSQPYGTLSSALRVLSSRFSDFSNQLKNTKDYDALFSILEYDRPAYSDQATGSASSDEKTSYSYGKPVYGGVYAKPVYEEVDYKDPTHSDSFGKPVYGEEVGYGEPIYKENYGGRKSYDNVFRRNVKYDVPVLRKVLYRNLGEKEVYFTPSYKSETTNDLFRQMASKLTDQPPQIVHQTKPIELPPILTQTYPVSDDDEDYLPQMPNLKFDEDSDLDEEYMPLLY